MSNSKLTKREDLHSLIEPQLKPKRQSIFDKVAQETSTNTKVQFTDNIAVDENKFLLFFRHFGIPLDRATSGQLVGTCPVCQKHKFYANASTGEWDCKTCPASGNIYTFIQWFNEHWLKQTTEDDYSNLARDRKFTVSISVMMEMQLSINRITGEWLLPGISMQQTYSNLYTYRLLTDHDSGEKYKQVVSAPLMSHVLYGAHALSPCVERPIWICEGHFDYLAWKTILQKSKQGQRFDVVGVCGSAGFPKHYANLLNNRIVFVCMDNDEEGEKHTTRLTNLLASTGTTPEQYKVIHWPKGLKKGFDLSDACAGLHTNP